MSTIKKSTPLRQRGTPSPGSSQQPTTINNRISPRRTGTAPTTKPNTNSSSTTTLTHRRGGSGSGATRNRTLAPSNKQSSRDEITQSYEDDHDSFLSKSSKYPTDRADDEVLSIYLESLKNPRERDSLQNFVNQQKIDAGFGIDVPTTYPNTKKGNINTKSSSLGVSDIESNVSDMSDTATEVIGYATGTNSRPNSKSSNRPPSHKHNNIQEHGDANILSPRPGAQRAILEIASQMTPEDIMEVIELLNSMKSQGNHQPPIPSPYSNYSSSFPPTQSYHHNSSPHSNNYPAAPTPSSRDPHKVTPPHPPSPQARRGKSGPPLLQSSNYVIGEEDEEVIQHTIHNETYRLIPPLSGPMSSSMSTLIHTNHNGSYSTTPSTLYGSYQSKHYRSGSAASNASGTNSTCNSRSSTPIHKRSPVPMNQHDICPTVNRDSNPPRSADTATPTPPKPIVVPPIVLPQSEIIETNPPAPVSQKQNNSKPTSKENNTGRNALLEYMHSPRSAFDDCSLSSSSSNFTSASNRSAKSKGSSTVKGNNTTSRRN